MRILPLRAFWFPGNAAYSGFMVSRSYRESLHGGERVLSYPFYILPSYILQLVAGF